MKLVPQLSTSNHQPAQRQRSDYEAANRFLIKARREMAKLSRSAKNSACISSRCSLVNPLLFATISGAHVQTLLHRRPTA